MGRGQWDFDEWISDLLAPVDIRGFKDFSCVIECLTYILSRELSYRFGIWRAWLVQYPLWGQPSQLARSFLLLAITDRDLS